MADGFLPEVPKRTSKKKVGLESVGILNTSNHIAEVELTVIFKDREPVGPYKINVPAQRATYILLNALQIPEPIPANTEYGFVITANAPILVQHAKVDANEIQQIVDTSFLYNKEN